MALFGFSDAQKFMTELDKISKAQLIMEYQENTKTSSELTEDLRKKLYGCIDSVLDSIQNETDEIIKEAADHIGEDWAEELADKALNSPESMEMFRLLLLLYLLNKDFDYEAYDYLSKVAKKIF